jgi:hypothetical protein
MLDRAYRYVPIYIIVTVSGSFTFVFEQSATNQIVRFAPMWGIYFGVNTSDR